MTFAFTVCLVANGLLAGFTLYHYAVTNRLPADVAEHYDGPTNQQRSGGRKKGGSGGGSDDTEDDNDADAYRIGWATALRHHVVTLTRASALQGRLFVASFGVSIWTFWRSEPVTFGLTASLFALATMWGLQTAVVAPLERTLRLATDVVLRAAAVRSRDASAGAGARGKDKARRHDVPVDAAATAAAAAAAAARAKDDDDGSGVEDVVLRDADIRAQLRRYGAWYSAVTLCAVAAFVLLCLSDNDYRTGTAA